MFPVKKLVDIPDAAEKRTQTDAPLNGKQTPPANTNGRKRTHSRLQTDGGAKHAPQGQVPPPLKYPPFCRAGYPPPQGDGHKVTVPHLGVGGGGGLHHKSVP